MTQDDCSASTMYGHLLLALLASGLGGLSSRGRGSSSLGGGLLATGDLVVQEGGGALAAVNAVEVGGHEGARAAVGALLAQALNLAGGVDLQRIQGINGLNNATILVFCPHNTMTSRTECTSMTRAAHAHACPTNTCICSPF